jgi:hypothetical protein
MMEQNKFSTLLVFIVPEITKLVIEEYQVSEENAAGMLYESCLYAALRYISRLKTLQADRQWNYSDSTELLIYS